MSKAKLFNIDDVVKDIKIDSQSLEVMAKDAVSFVRSEYEKVASRFKGVRYTPLDNPKNFSKKTGNYYKDKFKQRENLYANIRVNVWYEIRSQSIEIHATVEDGQGHAHNVFYFHDLGTEGGSQKRSPFFGKGASYAPPRTGIQGNNFSQEIAAKTRNYILDKYGKDLTVIIRPVTNTTVPWNNDPIIKQLPKP